MGLLVKVGGELYIPFSECSKGGMHYSFVDAEPIKIFVKPNRPALRYLRSLIGRLKNIDYSDEPTERINLLYPEKDSEMDVDLSDLNSNSFDFWVRGRHHEPIRFRFSCGEFFFNDERLNREKKVKDLFKNSRCLELTHAGSTDTTLIKKDDYDVVSTWHDGENEKAKKGLIENIRDSYKEEDISDLSVEYLHILSAVGAEPVDEEQIFDCFKETSHFCPCYFEDYGEDMESHLDYLARRGLVTEVTGEGYVSSLEAYQEFRKGELKESLEMEFYGLGHFAEDPVSAHTLLSLLDGPGKLRDILKDVTVAHETKVDERMLDVRLNEFMEKGIIKEDTGWFEISPEYLINYDSRQLELFENRC